MKTCSKCKIPKLESEFNKKSVMCDGLSSHCKTCSRILTNASYHKNPKYYRDNILKRRIRIRGIIDAIKSQTPCNDCNQKYPPYVMDFDHVDGKSKSFTISNGINLSEDRLMLEIKKCEIVCSNCHRIRTHLRRSCGDNGIIVGFEPKA
jgi:hypothetical protein